MAASQLSVSVTFAAPVKVPLPAGTKMVIVSNEGPNPVYLGHDATLTAATGLRAPLATASNPLLHELMAGTDLYAITTTADQVAPANLRILAYG